MNEISNMVLYHICRNRPVCNPNRHRSLSVVWPGLPASVPAIPFHEYERAIGDTFRFSNAANKRTEEYLDSLNCQRHPRNGGHCRFHSWPGNCDDQDGEIKK